MLLDFCLGEASQGVGHFPHAWVLNRKASGVSIVFSEDIHPPRTTIRKTTGGSRYWDLLTVSFILFIFPLGFSASRFLIAVFLIAARGVYSVHIRF